MLDTLTDYITLSQVRLVNSIDLNRCNNSDAGKIFFICDKAFFDLTNFKVFIGQLHEDIDVWRFVNIRDLYDTFEMKFVENSQEMTSAQFSEICKRKCILNFYNTKLSSQCH